MDYLKFQDIQIAGRPYYTADFCLHRESANSLHTHDFYEVITTTSGEFTEYSGGEKITLKKGRFHFVRPTDCHYLKSGENAANRIRNIAFEKSFFESMVKQANILDFDQIFTPSQLDEPEFDSFLRKIQMLDCMDNSEQTNLCVLESIFWDFLLHIKFTGRNAEIPQWLVSCCRTMEQEENLVQGLPRLLELSGKSQPHLTRQMKKYYHITPSDFINNLRIKKAASLLCLTNEKILDIALDCGFENISYFNRIFLKKYSVTPRQYRDINKKLLG